MSVKFEVKFESLLESLVDYTVNDDIKAKTFHNKHRKKYVLPFCRRDNYSLSPGFWQSFVTIGVHKDHIPALARFCKKQRVSLSAYCFS